MKKNILAIGPLLVMLSTLMLTSCMDEWDAPNVDDYSVTSPTSVGEPNITIDGLKELYFQTFSQTNSFVLVEDTLIVEGIVVANDEGGNLYQTLVLAAEDEGKQVDVSNCIVFAIKSTYLTPYFPMGQKVRVNLNGLYVGCYSKMPKIGQPYYTSSNNLRLGPMLFELCETKVQLIGSPEEYCDSIHPIVIYDDSHPLIARESEYQNYMNAPMLVTVYGKFVDGDDKTILAPDELKDAGMGVDRKFKIGKKTITVRTSTQNDVAFLPMPTNEVALTGVLSYYDGWQLQLRSTADMAVFQDVEPEDNNGNE